MNLKHIKALCKKGEKKMVEYKTSTSTLHAAFKAICAFLNGKGGTVLVGVTDSKMTVSQIAEKLENAPSTRMIGDDLAHLQRFPKILEPLPCFIAAPETSSGLRSGGRTALLPPDNPPSRKGSKLLGTAIKQLNFLTLEGVGRGSRWLSNTRQDEKGAGKGREKNDSTTIFTFYFGFISRSFCQFPFFIRENI